MSEKSTTHKTADPAPEDRSDQLRTLLTQIAEKLSSPAPELPAGVVGDDIRSFLDSIATDVAKQLTVVEETIGLSNYSTRLLPFTREVRNKRTLWTPCAPHYAETVVLSDNVEHLRSLMEKMHESTDAKTSICLWLHPHPTPSGHATTALLRHSSGLERVYLVKGPRWIPVPAAGAEVDLILRAMLGFTRSERRYWKDVYRALIGEVLDIDDDRRNALRKALGGAPALDSEQLLELAKALLNDDSILQVLMEIARSSAGPVLREAHALLVVLTDISESAVDAMTKTEARLQREHARDIKTARAQVDRLKSAEKLTARRIEKLEADLRDARAKLRVAGASTTQSSPGASEAGEIIPCAVFESYFVEGSP